MRAFASLLLAGLLLVPLMGQSAPISGQGTWETTLQGRDLTGDGVFDVFYDTVLDISWLANANLAATETFGLTRSASEVFPDSGEVGSTGRMDWSTANTWITAMNSASHLGFDDWRLPLLSPVDGESFNLTTSNDATTDSGHARTTTDGSGGGWRDEDGHPVSEMGHMYYVTLGNVGRCTPDEADPESCEQPDDWGLANTAEIINLQELAYWTGVPSVFDTAWVFVTVDGGQFSVLSTLTGFAWAVRPGDVAAAHTVPEPGAIVLLAAGLLGLFGLRRTRRR